MRAGSRCGRSCSTATGPRTRSRRSGTSRCCRTTRLLLWRRARTWCCGAGSGRRTSPRSCGTRSTPSSSSSCRCCSGRARTCGCTRPRWPRGRGRGSCGTGRSTTRAGSVRTRSAGWTSSNGFGWTGRCRRASYPTAVSGRGGPAAGPTTRTSSRCSTSWWPVVRSRPPAATAANGCGTWPSGSTRTSRHSPTRRRPASATSGGCGRSASPARRRPRRRTSRTTSGRRASRPSWRGSGASGGSTPTSSAGRSAGERPCCRRWTGWCTTASG